MIDVNHVTKEFQLGQLQNIRLSAQRMIARLNGLPLPERSRFKALDDVNFKVDQGEVLGIIGHNGAGKSTLLKILSRITVPSTGNVQVRGRVAPLIEVGAGLAWDLTGRENIYLNAAILGMSRKETERKFDEIVEFSELKEFLDTPIKRFSSGMAIRLAFSIATSVEADILIVDEVLTVGDLAFQRKCFDRMEELIKRQGKTILLVSHNIRQVERLCSRVILLDHGKITEDGNSTAVCNAFFDLSNTKMRESVTSTRGRNLQLTEDISIPSFQIFDENGTPTDRIKCTRPMRVHLEFDVLRPLHGIGFLVGIHTSDFIYLTATNTGSNTPYDYEPGHHVVEMNIRSMNLLPGIYSIRAWIGNAVGRVSFYGEMLCTFQVYSDDRQITRQQDMGLFLVDADWVLNTAQKARS